MHEDSPRRRRGRPRKADGGDARSRIVSAAAEEFGDKGYDAASLRGIARRAGVDAALVHHYFDGKSALFAEIVAVPLRPERVVRAALDVPLESMGVSLVRTLFEVWERPAVQPVAATMLRTAVGTSAGSRLVKEFLFAELVGAIQRRLDAPDAALRAEAAVSQIGGLLILRYVLKVEPIASADVEDLVRRIAPVVQWHLTGDPNSGAARRVPPVRPPSERDTPGGS